MDIVVVIGKNMLDISKIQAVGENLSHQVITCTSTMKIKNMMMAGPGDRHFIIIFDYYIYENGDMDVMRKEIDEAVDKYGIDPVEYRSFVPHEKIPELTQRYPDVKFIARSAFLRDLKEHLI